MILIPEPVGTLSYVHRLSILFKYIYILIPPKRSPPQSSQDGIVDSLRHLIIQDNYVKPYGNDHYLAASLLSKAF